MEEDIKIRFVIPKDCRNQNECSEDMQLAFVNCEQHSGGGLEASWVNETQWKQYEGLTKRHVFVMNEFRGEMFEKLRATRCLLVGPRCLSCCLTEGLPIPSGPEPVFTVAMRGLVVSASGLSKQQKENLKNKVHWMGGIYSNVLTEDTTHLVSETVLSDKYQKSLEKGIPIMSQRWIEAVWEASLTFNINGSSQDYINPHKLKAFHNLHVTTSGLSKTDKQMVMKLVNENGGMFSGSFQSETTDIVVLNKDGVGSEKYKAALEYGKACVVPEWVRRSAARGAVLPTAAYRVAGALTSSPLNAARPPDMSLNFSRITNVRANNNVDETRSTDVTTLSAKMKQPSQSQESKRADTSFEREIAAEFENFDMSAVKKAGPIFDGFCIWVTGLEGVARERAHAIVSRAGGVRYDAPHERVTHVACGGRGAAARAAAASPAPALSARWLLASVAAGRPLPHVEFLMDMKPCTPSKSGRKPAAEAASPMSKRNLQLLRRGPLHLPPPTELPAPPQDDLVNHYLSQHLPEERPQERSPEPAPANITTRVEQPENADITEDHDDEPTEEIEQIFRGMKIEVQGLDEEDLCELAAEVGAAGGLLTAAGAGGSHALVPLDFNTHDLLTEDAEPVTVFWVKDCLSQQELVPLQYYHRPVRLGPERPLRGVVASLSTYSGVERAFLDELAKLLGATTQLRFCRRNTANASASTHLICPTPSGDKYSGAVKWGLPAVRADWLLACAARGERVRETDYLVGDSKAPSSPQKPTTPSKAENAQAANTSATDKENAMLPPAAAPRRGSLPSADHTPKANGNVDAMSPASRYIAMARQGLLGCDSQDTPKRVADLKDEAGQEGVLRTPSLEDALSSPNLAALSPRTRRRLQAVRRGEMPSEPLRTPQGPFDDDPPTPDSAFGAALRPGGRLSPEARKRLWKVVQNLPGKPPETAHDKHTPLSEIRNRFLAQFYNSDAPTPPSDHHAAPRKLQLQDADTPPAKMARLCDEQRSPGTVLKKFNPPETDESKSLEGDEESGKSASSTLPAVVDAQLLRLDAVLSNRLSSQRPKRLRESTNVPPPAMESEPGPESQPNTVGWDDSRPAAGPPAASLKRFMLSSNVDNREEIVEAIEYLGGSVSEGAELDPAATHLLCCAPGRSEKMLGSVAAGRWVLHPAYIARSRLHGAFLPEEEFEWGNPGAASLPALGAAEAVLARAAHRWRQARGCGEPGPFRGVTALLHVPAARRRLLARLVEAGDGSAPPLEPPYNDESITVCFADVKRYPLSERDAAWLSARGVPVCAPVLLSAYLTDDATPDPHKHCLPDYRPAGTT